MTQQMKKKCDIQAMYFYLFIFILPIKWLKEVNTVSVQKQQVRHITKIAVFIIKCPESKLKIFSKHCTTFRIHIG